jgi:hypothetical protein
MSFSHDSRNSLVWEQRIFPVITLLFLNTSGERETRKFGQWGTWSPCFTDAPRSETMKRTGRNHGTAFKPQVAFAVGQGEKTLAELAPQFGVPPTQTTEWKPQLLTQAVGVCGGTPKATMDALDLQVLHAKIGPLALEHDVLEGTRALRRASLDGSRETNTDLIPAERNTSKLGRIIGWRSKSQPRHTLTSGGRSAA